MYPDLFGIHDFSYTLCMLIGIIVAFVLGALYFKKVGIKKSGVTDLLICACFAVVSGIIFAVLFENFYEMIELGKEYKWVFKMTFFGGLFGGVIGFLFTYYLMRKNVNFKIGDVLKIAPVSIAIAHAFGRIGCFLAGCCYGKTTDSWIGIEFPGTGKVIPTQLIEAIFLFILFGVMAFLLYKKQFKYNFVIYMIGYGVFRFIIEFYRGDPRGVATILSPSQFWSILIIVGSVPIYFVEKKLIKDAEK